MKQGLYILFFILSISVFSFVLSQWPLTLLEKLLLLFLLFASVSSSCVFICSCLVVMALHDDSIWDFVRVFNGYIDPGTQEANLVLSVRAGVAKVRLSERQVNRRCALNTAFELIVFCVCMYVCFSFQ